MLGVGENSSTMLKTSEQQSWRGRRKKTCKGVRDKVEDRDGKTDKREAETPITISEGVAVIIGSRWGDYWQGWGEEKID